MRTIAIRVVCSRIVGQEALRVDNALRGPGHQIRMRRVDAAVDDADADSCTDVAVLVDSRRTARGSGVLELLTHATVRGDISDVALFRYVT